jgi:hypothetical protein
MPSGDRAVGVEQKTRPVVRAAANDQQGRSRRQGRDRLELFCGYSALESRELGREFSREMQGRVGLVACAVRGLACVRVISQVRDLLEAQA